VLKGVPSGGTGVEELRREEAIWTLKCEVEWIADGTVTEGLADGTVTEDLADGTVTEGLADGTA